MYTYKTNYFDIKQIAESGQCFRMSELTDNRWLIIAGRNCLILNQQDDTLYMSCTKDEFDSFWRNYFDLDYDYDRVINSIEKNDIYLTGCAKTGSGIRILRQDLWEMLITFMVSQNNNIPRIKNSIKKLCDYAGDKLYISSCSMSPHDNISESIEYHAFPSPEAIADIPLDVLHGFGLGYRDEYLHLAGEKVASGEFKLDYLSSLSYEDSVKYLMELKGVGKKVANCVCLFGLHHIDAFPIDTHIKQILSDHYPDGFPFDRYNGYAGILQQYMFFSHL